MLAPPEGGKEASPSFLEFRAIEPFDPPALLAGTGTADAFWVVADLAAGLSEKRICIVIDCLHLLHWGVQPPYFRLFFALCRLFTRQVGYLPYPREENGTQGRQWATTLTGGVKLTMQQCK